MLVEIVLGVAVKPKPSVAFSTVDGLPHADGPFDLYCAMPLPALPFKHAEPPSLICVELSRAPLDSIVDPELLSVQQTKT